MSETSEFREELRAVIRRHDPSADDLRAVAADLETLADRFEAAGDTL